MQSIISTSITRSFIYLRAPTRFEPAHERLHAMRVNPLGANLPINSTRSIRRVTRFYYRVWTKPFCLHWSRFSTTSLQHLVTSFETYFRLDNLDLLAYSCALDVRQRNLSPYSPHLVSLNFMHAVVINLDRDARSTEFTEHQKERRISIGCP